MTKTLYFEGAGMFNDEFGDLGNCRIRTCFADDSGRVLYLEVSGIEKDSRWLKHHPELKGSGRVAFIDFLFEATGDHEDCNKNCLPEERGAYFAYGKYELLAFVNSLGCSFDSVEVLPELAGYRVHAGRDEYNRGDLFEPDWGKTRRAEQIRSEEYDAMKTDGVRFPNVCVWRNPDDLNELIIKHPNPKYKHRNRTVRLDAEVVPEVA